MSYVTQGVIDKLVIGQQGTTGEFTIVPTSEYTVKCDDKEYVCFIDRPALDTAIIAETGKIFIKADAYLSVLVTVKTSKAKVEIEVNDPRLVSPILERITIL